MYEPAMNAFKVAGFMLLMFSYGECDVTCMRCESASAVEDCVTNEVTCGQNENCFLERVTVSVNRTVFNAGCRSEVVCKIMQSLGQATGKKKRSIVTCAQCCNSPANPKPCNTQLCGQTPSALPETCLYCPQGVYSPSHCQTTQVCQDTQICYNEVYWNGRVQYKFGCESKHVCDKLANLQHRRDTGIPILCSACCTGNNCNREDCYLLRNHITPSPMHGFL